MDDAPRLTSRFLVEALVRRVQQEGGFASVLHCGNDAAGALIIECRDRGIEAELLEKSTDFDGFLRWRRIEAPNAASAKWIDEYRLRRVENDPDLWWIELDIAGAARFADEMTSLR